MTDEKNLGDLYSIIVADNNAFILPDNVSKDDLKDYIENMIKANQPRLKRTDGRPSFNIDDYKIPQNYFMVDSNTVSFHATRGGIYIPDDETVLDELGTTEQVLKDTEVSVPNRFREDDIGTQICLYIFKYGRKTLEELIKELPSYDKNMIILLINKLLLDNYLQKWKDDDLETLELVAKEKKEKKALK